MNNESQGAAQRVSSGRGCEVGTTEGASVPYRVAEGDSGVLLESYTRNLYIQSTKLLAPMRFLLSHKELCKLRGILWGDYFLLTNLGDLPLISDRYIRYYRGRPEATGMKGTIAFHDSVGARYNILRWR